jgi:hypothetical protein
MVAGVGVLGALGIASPAAAAAPSPFTLTDYVNNATGVYTFTTTGPLCESGTFMDDVKLGLFPVSDHANPTAGGIILIRTTLTCDDGSGSFFMLKHLSLTFNNTGFTDAGPEEILGGTGAYAGITGHGFTTGAMDLGTGIGAGTTTGIVQLG